MSFTTCLPIMSPDLTPPINKMKCMRMKENERENLAMEAEMGSGVLHSKPVNHSSKEQLVWFETPAFCYTIVVGP